MNLFGKSKPKRRRKPAPKGLDTAGIRAANARRRQKEAEARAEEAEARVAALEARRDTLPKAKLEQMARHMRVSAQQQYESANTGRWENDWLLSTNTPYNDIRGSLKATIARSRRAINNCGFAERAVQEIVDNVVSDGLRPIPLVKKKNGEPDQRINEDLRYNWEIFVDEWDRSKHSTFYGNQRLALRTIFTSGSILTNQVPSGGRTLLPIAYQMKEPDRLDSSKDTAQEGIWNNQKTAQVAHGIMLSEYDEPLAYIFQGVDEPVSAQFMKASYRRTRPEQYIGMPWMAPVLKRMWDVQNLIEDQAIKSRIQAMIALWFESESGTPNIGPQDADDSTFEWRPGVVGSGPTGSKPHVIQADADIKDGYLPIIRLLLREIAGALGLSYYSLARDLEGVNFAGSRALILDERRGYTGSIGWFNNEYNQPHYNDFVMWSAITGTVKGLTIDRYLRDPHKYNNCFWVHRPWDWVDPESDVNALIKLKEAGWTTDDMYLRGRGISIQDHYEQLMKEKQLKDEMGIQPAPVDKGNTNGRNNRQREEEEEAEARQLSLFPS